MPISGSPPVAFRIIIDCALLEVVEEEEDDDDDMPTTPTTTRV